MANLLRSKDAKLRVSGRSPGRQRMMKDWPGNPWVAWPFAFWALKVRNEEPELKVIEGGK